MENRLCIRRSGKKHSGFSLGAVGTTFTSIRYLYVPSGFSVVDKRCLYSLKVVLWCFVLKVGRCYSAGSRQWRVRIEVQRARHSMAQEALGWKGSLVQKGTCAGKDEKNRWSGDSCSKGLESFTQPLLGVCRLWGRGGQQGMTPSPCS